MPIIYGVIARGSIVLCEHMDGKGNAKEIVRTILTKIPSNDSQMSYIYEDYTFHYIISRRICYMCMTEKGFDRRVAFSFLQNVQQQILSSYGDSVYSAPANGLRDFSSQLQTSMAQFSAQSVDKLKLVQNDVDELRGVVEQNIDKILARQEKIELLVDQSEELNQSAQQFRKKSTGLKRTMWYKNIKLWIILILIVLVIIFVIVLIACGGFTFRRCRK